MDPASAAITFVGFAASLATFVAVVVDSAKTLSNLQQQLRDAPKNVARLVERFEILQNLLQEVQAVSIAHGENELPESLRKIWKASAAQLKDDIENFRVLIARLEQTLNNSKGSSVKLRLRTRDFFSESKVSEFEKRLSIHFGTLQLIRASILDLKLDAVKNQNRELENITLTGFQAVYSGLSKLESRQHQNITLLEQSHARIDDRFQRLRNNLEVGPLRSIIGPRRMGKESKTSIVAAAYLTLHSYVLPFGRLQVKVLRKSLSSHSKETNDATSSISQVSFSFVPPHWLSDLAVRSNLDIFYNLNTDLPGLGFSINAVSVNHNPLVIQAIHTSNVVALQELFTAGLARPSDHVIDPTCGICSMLSYFCRIFSLNFGGYFEKEQETLEMFRFLVERSKSNLQKEFSIMFWHDQLNGSRIKPYLEVFLMHEGSVLINVGTSIKRADTLSPIFISEIGFGSEDLARCLFGQSESWAVEDLHPTDVWFIGVIAYKDEIFRAHLEAYLNCFQSPFGPRRGVSGEQIIRTTFAIDVIVAQVMSAWVWHRKTFLEALCTSGTRLMLEPFLNAGFGVNEDLSYCSYLGKAAYAKNVETFQILLENGASVSPALEYLLDCERVTCSKKFLRYYITAMVDRITYLDFDDYHHDPILILLNGWSERGDSDVTTQELEHLLGTGLFNHGRLFGAESVPLSQSYVYRAIQDWQDEALNLFLKLGVDPHRQIGHQFDCSSGLHKLRVHSWLTLAVHFGRVPCVEVLLRYGDMHIRNEHGRSALEWARYYTTGRHPRHALTWGRTIYEKDDRKILALLEKSFASQPMSSSDDVTASRDILPEPDVKTVAIQHGNWRNFIHSTRQLFTRLVWSPSIQRQSRRYRHKWNDLLGLSYTDALLMRIGYVLSYILLLFLETVAIATWLRELPAPPRSVLVASIVLLLGLTYSLGTTPPVS
ncbi:hypothetical protein MMC18_001283 [Xylographa bjoerkii]|nr:hypothetical protein [Xylographa bjoerkii]